MELLLADKLGYPKGFNGFEWSSLPADGIKKRQMPSYLVEDLPNTDGFSIRAKFKEVSFAEAPKIGYFKPFIKTNYEIFRKEQMKKDKLNQIKQKKKDNKYMKNMVKEQYSLKQHSADLGSRGSQYQEQLFAFNKQDQHQFQSQYSQQQQQLQLQQQPQMQQQNNLDFVRNYSATPTLSSSNPHHFLTALREKMIQQRKDKKENEKKKQQLIDDLHYYKIFADKNSRLTIDCVDNISKMMDDENKNIDQDQETSPILQNESLATDFNHTDHHNTTSLYQQQLQQNNKQSVQDEKVSTTTQKQNNYIPKINQTTFMDKKHEQQYQNSMQMQENENIERMKISPIQRNSYIEIDIDNDNHKGENQKKKQIINQGQRTRQVSLYQQGSCSSQLDKPYYSTAHTNFQSRGSKRINMNNHQSLSDYNNNQLQQTSISFFKGDETLYRTFQTPSKNHSKTIQNSHLLSTATSNKLNEQSHSFANKSFSQQDTNHIQNRFSITNYNTKQNTTFAYKNKTAQSKTPKSKSNSINVNENKNRFLTPQKRGTLVIEEDSSQTKENNNNNKKYHTNSNNNNNSIQVKEIIKLQLQDGQQQEGQNTQYLSFQSQRNNFFVSPQKNNKKQSIALSPNLQYSAQRNISPSILNQSLNGDLSVHSQIRSKRDTQTEYIQKQRDFIDADFLKKSDSHHNSIMYAMKTLKKKFGLLNNKFDPQTAML